MLDHVAGERGQHQDRKQQCDRSQHFALDPAGNGDQPAAVDRDLVRIGDQPAEGRGQAAAHRAGKRGQHQRAAAGHEPGRHLLALDHVATLERLVETFLGWVFCAV
jgi:hypothetical protein